MKRIIYKKTSQDQLIFEVENLWAEVLSTIGKYSKIIEFVSTQRRDLYMNMMNATRNGNNSGLDVVDKYCILNDLQEQIRNLKSK